MAKRPTPRKVRPKSVRLERAEAALSTEQESIRAHVQHLNQHLIAEARKAQTPPGIAVMAACEFIALMLNMNIPVEEQDTQLSSHVTYIRDRLQELNADDAPRLH